MHTHTGKNIIATFAFASSHDQVQMLTKQIIKRTKEWFSTKMQFEFWVLNVFAEISWMKLKLKI